MAETRASYAASHRDRVNLALHIVAVPLFVGATAYLFVALVRGDVRAALAGVAGLGVSLAAQGLGHRREAVRPAPFSGAWDAVARVPVEQFWGFWVFLVSGDWWRALRRAR